MGENKAFNVSIVFKSEIEAAKAGIEAITLSPMLGDFNEDLATYGLDAVRAEIRVQIAPEDVSRFMASIA